MGPRTIALACAAAAIAVCGVAAVALASDHGSVTVLVHMSAAEPMASVARKADPSFVFVDTEAHYDGVYFYAMALDPLARGREHLLIDRPAYRYGHVGFSWLVRLVSLGKARLIPGVMLLLTLLGAGASGFIASRWADELGWSPWWGMAVALSPGIVYAVTADTSEPVAFAIVAVALLAWSRGRWLVSGIALAAACLTKEPLLVAPAGVALWELIQNARTRDEQLRRKLAALAIAPIVFLIWYAYLRHTFGVWPFQQEARDYFTVPYAGWFDSMRRAATMAAGTFTTNQLGNAAIPLLAVFAAALTIGIIRAARLKTLLDAVFILSALLILSLNWLGVLYPKDLIRESAITMLILPAAIAGRRATPAVVTASSRGRDDRVHAPPLGEVQTGGSQEGEGRQTEPEDDRDNR